MRFVRARRLWVAALLALAGALVAPLLAGGGSQALAHPLGNFTINRYSRIELAPDAVSLRYVLDMAEIPAFQERPRIDTDGDGEVSPAEGDAYAGARAGEIAASFALQIDGAAVALRPAATELTFPAGVGGLDTLRLVIDYRAPLEGGWAAGGPRLEYRDTNYAERPGWSEVVVRSRDGVSVVDATAPEQDVTNELRAYPGDGLANPLHETGATFSAMPGAGTAVPATSAEVTADDAAGRANDRFTSLITSEELSATFILGAMGVAFVFGALHALGPGHGKTVVAAYLVGERGTARHAVLLGLLVTVTHTSAVFALAFVTLYASQFVVPERLYPWLSLTSGLLVVGLGALLLAGRARTLLRQRAHDRAHASGDAHDHDHGHSHEVPQEVSWKALAALGVSGGILPCPSALVVLLGAISLHRVGLGLLLVIGFSAGLATVLMAIGIGLVWAGRALSRSRATRHRRLGLAWTIAGRLAPVLPALSAFAVTAVGIVMTARALGDPGAFGL